jgi:hypothetical protein
MMCLYLFHHENVRGSRGTGLRILNPGTRQRRMIGFPLQLLYALWKDTLIFMGQEAWWAPEQVWMLWWGGVGVDLSPATN